MGIYIGIHHISFDVSDDRGEHTEKNSDDQRPAAEAAGIAAHDGFRGNDSNMMPSEIWLTEFSKNKTDSSKAEDNNVIRTQLIRISLRCENDINTGYHKRIGKTDQ